MGFDWTAYIQTAKTEIRERLQALNDGLLRLEGEATNHSLMDEVFRHAHSIKGSAQMVGLDLVAKVAHGLEDALGAVRAGKLGVSAALLDVAFQALDMLENLLKDPPPAAALSQAEPLAAHLAAIGAGGPVKRFLVEGETEATEQPAQARREETEFAGSQETVLSEQELSEPLAGEKEGSPPPPAPAAADSGWEVMRVPLDRVDRLLRLVGDLANLEHQERALVDSLGALHMQARRLVKVVEAGAAGTAQEHVRAMKEAARQLGLLARSARRLAAAQAIVGREIRDAAMDLRLLPVATLFDRFPRPVRDLARVAGKKVHLVIEGGETRLDKRILDGLYDPLLHLLRNAVDHGVELPAERVAAGKPECATILVRAMSRGRTVVVEVSDDGRGISVESVRQAACDRALMTRSEVAALSDEQVLQILFRPGFSTASQVTAVSGRGVGLDVVYNNVRELKGVVRVTNSPGQGATFSLEIPLTLATTRVLLFECGDGVYALPGPLVQGVVSAREADWMAACGQQTIQWNGRTVVVWPLAAVLGRSSRDGPAGKMIVLAEGVGGIIGVLVDRLLDEEEVVLKPVGTLLQGVRLVSAGTVLGDGRVALLLDVDALAQAASRLRGGIAITKEKESSRRRSILLADDALTTREVERAILEAAGYEVTAVADGLAAWEKLGERTYDLVITDVEMPRMDGFELTKRIVSDPRTADVPVVMITSLAKEEDRRRGLECGAAAYIVKSAFDQENLLDLIERLIR